MLKISYDINDNGSKKLYVLLHGWGMNRRCYNRFTNLIHDSSIAFDLPGHGDSGDPYDYFDTYEYAYQIFLCLVRFVDREIVLVGHSFGGRLALLLSSVFKINVVGLILTSSAGINKFSITKFIRVRIYKVCKWFVNKNVLSKKVLSNFGSDDYNNANVLLRRILVRVVNQDLRVFLGYIKCRTLLVWDRRDKVTPYWICKKISRCIANSKIVLFARGGHFVFFCNESKVIDNI
ncbi:MAG: alpha/beta hydrolase [Clostridiales bacterium]|nr:alpha/beta hydrolase [Clostridiales bacterium]